MLVESHVAHPDLLSRKVDMASQRQSVMMRRILDFDNKFDMTSQRLCALMFLLMMTYGDDDDDDDANDDIADEDDEDIAG